MRSVVDLRRLVSLSRKLSGAVLGQSRLLDHRVGLSVELRQVK